VGCLSASRVSEHRRSNAVPTLLVAFSGIVLATLMLSSTLARATTLITPFKAGSAGGTTFAIQTFAGIFQPPLESVSFGGTPMKIVMGTTVREGIVCAEATEKELAECPGESE
jgi:hypothetical protein